MRVSIVSVVSVLAIVLIVVMVVVSFFCGCWRKIDKSLSYLEVLEVFGYFCYSVSDAWLATTWILQLTYGTPYS